MRGTGLGVSPFGNDNVKAHWKLIWRLLSGNIAHQDADGVCAVTQKCPATGPQVPL